MAETKLLEVLKDTQGQAANTFGILSQRVIGAFPLSIGTSLAFESMFEGQYEPYDPERKIPEKIRISNYQTIWIHLGLLFRNIFNAVSPDQARLASVEEYADSIAFEMDVIESLLANEGGGVCAPIFYYCDYKTLYKMRLPLGVRLRQDETPKKQEYQALYVRAIGRVLKTYQHKDTVRKLDSELRPDTYTRSLVMTQYAYDLLSAHKFKKLDLLESYTGILKPKHLWYSKYYQGRTLTALPFQRRLLYIFGDHELFHPFPHKFRQIILDVANQRNWSPLSSEDKIDRDVRTTIRNIHILDVWKHIQ